MKKTFLAMCMVAMGFLAVSCYDDSRLWDEVESLGDRVEKLEKDLQADVENLNALQNKVNSLETSLTEAIAAGDKAVKEALEKKLTDLETKLTAAQQAGDQAIVNELLKEKEALTTALTQLSEGLTGVTGSVEKLNAALKALEASVGAGYTELLGKLDAVDGKIDSKVADMTAALAALKAELSETIAAGDSTLAVKDAELAAALAEAIAKISVVKVEKVDGKVILTLADGSTVEVSAPLTNVANTGLVTIVEVEGVKYWAVVEADGTPKNLEVVVGHPDQEIDFRVNDATGELEYAVNGGEWIATGIVAEVANENAAIITDFEESENYVTMTIGGVEVVLPKYVERIEYKVNIKSGKQFFAYEETKSVPVQVEGVSTFVVMTKPDGWKAKINGSKLMITAPDSVKVATGFADFDGQVVLHGNTADGQCKTAVLNVSLGKGFELSIDDEGVISIVNSNVVTSMDWWGNESTDFGDAVIGICTVAEYSAYSSFSEFYTAAYDYGEFGGYAYLNNVKNNIEVGGWYEPEVYEVDKYSFTIEQLGSAFWPEYQIEKGQQYVVWAVPQDEETALLEDYVVAFYESVVVEYESEITWSEIALTVTTFGSDVFYAGAVPATMFSEESGTFDDYMEVGNGMGGGPWKQFKQYGFEAMGQEYESGSEISVAELTYSETLLPGTEYYVWLMPKQPGKAPADYDYEKDFKKYLFTFTTDTLATGATPAEIELNEDETNYSTIAVDVTPAEGTSVYYYFYEVGEVDEMTDAEILIDVMDNCYYPVVEAETVTEDYLSDGESKVFVAVTVSADGKYAITTLPCSTLSYPYFEEGAVTVTVQSVTLSEDGYYTAVLNVTGDANKVALYSNYSSTYSNMNKYVIAQNTTLNWADVVDGVATVTFKNRGASYPYAIYSVCKVTEAGVEKLTKQASFKMADYLPAAE